MRLPNRHRRLTGCLEAVDGCLEAAGELGDQRFCDCSVTSGSVSEERDWIIRCNSLTSNCQRPTESVRLPTSFHSYSFQLQR